MLRNTSWALLFMITGCGGGTTTTSDAGMDGGPALDVGVDGGHDAAVVNDVGSDAGSDVGNDAFVAPDAAMLEIHAACVTSAVAAIGTGGVGTIALPTVSGSMGSFTYQQCPSGADASANPPMCTAEADWGNAALAVATDTPTSLHLTGTLPLRVADLQIHTACADSHAAFNADGACPGGTFGTAPVDLQITVSADGASLTVTQVTSAAQLQTALDGGAQVCGIPSCDAICCITNLCGCAWAGNGPMISRQLLTQTATPIEAGLKDEIEQVLCRHDDCPADAPHDANGLCRHADGSCVPGDVFYSGC